MMRARATIRQLAPLVVALIAVDAVAQDARSWLDRMNRAVEELNYEGTFVHALDGNTETMHIVHRNDNGRIGERIVSLNGVGREIIRNENEVQCILPDRRVVLLDETADANPLVSALPSYSEDLEPNYTFNVYRSARVADRPAQVIGIRPRDEFRYGYLLWLDQETAMPLKAQLRDENDEIVEQILFVQFEIFDSIPAAALEPTIDTAGFSWLRSEKAGSLPSSTVLWRAGTAPGGFKLAVATHKPLAGAEYPVEHLVYSDGLATVSVFIEDPKADADVVEGFSNVGSTNAYSLTLSGHKVTAIGEVPRLTVHQIASSLIAE